MLTELQSAVRKVKWLSLATAVTLFVLLAMGLLTATVRLALLFSGGTLADATDTTGRLQFTVAMGTVLFIDLLCFGVPGALMVMAYRRASDSLTTQMLPALVPTIAWLRRFLMCGVLLLLALLGMTGLITLLDLARYLRG
jgi:hypothetical protein